jgi:hypothetical protein
MTKSMYTMACLTNQIKKIIIIRKKKY